MGKKKPEDHIPRPSNKFILFHVDKIAEFKDWDQQARRPVLTQLLYLNEAAVLWNSLGETSNIKLYYTERAKEALAEHQLKYLDYTAKRLLGYCKPRLSRSNHILAHIFPPR